jgi:hypothetical protein
MPLSSAINRMPMVHEREGNSRPAVDEPDHRHRRLLRTRRHRPCHRRTTEPRDELSPFDHSITPSARKFSIGCEFDGPDK